MNGNSISCSEGLFEWPSVEGISGTIEPSTPVGTLIVSTVSSDLEWVDQYQMTLGQQFISASSTTTVYTPSPVPEFPSPILPTAVVIGFLGVVLFFRRMREQ